MYTFTCFLVIASNFRCICMKLIHYEGLQIDAYIWQRFIYMGRLTLSLCDNSKSVCVTHWLIRKSWVINKKQRCLSLFDYQLIYMDHQTSHHKNCKRRKTRGYLYSMKYPFKLIIWLIMRQLSIAIGSASQFPRSRNRGRNRGISYLKRNFQCGTEKNGKCFFTKGPLLVIHQSFTINVLPMYFMPAVAGNMCQARFSS